MKAQAERWLEQFERALGDEAHLGALFHPGCHWRDLLALTGHIHTESGREAVLAALGEHAGRARPTGFIVDPGRTAPRKVMRAGTDAIEAIFRFETVVGRASGVLRLTTIDGATRAWTLFTTLVELKGHEEHLGRTRPTGLKYSREFRGPNWQDLRQSSAAYTDRDPAVLVVGGGHAGLSIAARLKSLRVDTLVVDRWPRRGDNWRRRYHALTLHNRANVNHLPYLSFPPNWPAYIPKDKIAGWLEAYVELMEINYWTGTEFQGGTYDDTKRRWTVALRSENGKTRELHPRHVVLATGVSGIPNLPDIPGLRDFAGKVLHSSQYEDGEAWAGKRAIVLGTGNSGHDIAQDLYAGGAKVTLVQRRATHIVNLEPSAQLPYALYDEGPPLEDCDLIAASLPLELARESHRLLTAKAKEIDRELHAALTRVGFKLDDGDEGTGWQFRYLTRGGGYCFNVGCSDLLASGEIGLAQFTDIARFDAQGARLRGGEALPADLVVLATGYKGQEALVDKLFGAEVAARVGPIWGFGEDQELRNMFARTPQPGLWFIAGSFAQCRIYSHTLGLQIKAQEEGLT
jgi:putative flavoprotein involved in K+ transport